MKKKLSFSGKMFYSLGQLGWSLTSFGVMNLLNYFYNPIVNNDGSRVFPYFLISIVTLSLIGGVGRTFDAITDPVIAVLSDKSKSKFGRRMSFLRMAVVPFSILSVLVFLPISQNTIIANLWFSLCVFLFYIAMTMYVVPFFALLNEITSSSKERVEISTAISFGWAIGFMIGNQIYSIQGIFEGMGYTAQVSFQIIIVIFAIIGFILMCLPIIFIKEKDYSNFIENSTSMSMSASLKLVFKNKNFFIFSISQLIYFISLTFIQTGVSYYVVQLLGLDKGATSLFMTLMFVSTFIYYVPIMILSQKIGKKNLLLIAFVLLSLPLILMFSWEGIKMDPTILGIATLLLAAIPIACFAIVPNAIVSDLAQADGIENGYQQAGVFFGVQTFITKLGASITLIIFPILANLSSSDNSPTIFGLKASIGFAFVIVIIGFITLFFYNEKRTMEILKTVEEV